MKFSQTENKKENKYTSPIHTFDKNYIFNTYIIEIISDEKFVIYPVIWRGEGKELKNKLCVSLVYKNATLNNFNNRKTYYSLNRSFVIAI